MNEQNIKLIFEHRFFIPKTSQVEWLKNFLRKNTLTKLWIKTFSLDKYYANILKNQNKRGCNVRVLIDNTKNKYTSNTPYQQLLNKTLEKPNTFSQNFFPLKTGSLHNKYVIFRNKEKREGKKFIQEGIVTGSFNLMISSEFKSNDLVIYYIEYSEDIGIPGRPRLFLSKNEALLQQNLRRSLFDFSKDWVNDDLFCPICDSKSLSEAIYCHSMTFKEGGVHLLSDTGNYEACEECPNWCSDGDSPDIILFQLDNESIPESVFVCSLCDAIFTESGGLIGNDLVVFFATEVEHNGKKMIIRPQNLSNLTI